MGAKNFWIASLERALKTAAQSLILFWAVGDGLLNAWSVNWSQAAGIALGGFILSIVTSIASAAVPVGGQASPSLTDSK